MFLQCSGEAATGITVAMGYLPIIMYMYITDNIASNSPEAILSMIAAMLF